MEHEHTCTNPEHTDAPRCLVFSNDLGVHVTLCERCVKADPRTYPKCGLCDERHTGKTLRIKSVFVFATDDDDDESFCCQCVGKQLPEFMHKCFQFGGMLTSAILSDYYRTYTNGERIDFSSVESIYLVDRAGERYTPAVPGAFGHALYAISKDVPSINSLLRDDFIPEMRKRALEKRSNVQAAHMLYTEELKAMMKRVVPTSEGYSGVLALFPPRIAHSNDVALVFDMRKVHCFSELLAFVQKYK